MAATHRIILGSDHAGYELKEEIKKYLSELGISVEDVGAQSDEPSDYPIFISEVASAVSSGAFELGIAIDGLGIGASMVANRFPRVRAALCINSDMARLARAHNDANVLVLGGWMSTMWETRQMIDIWIKTKFEGGRHARRISQIDNNTTLKIAMGHLNTLPPNAFAEENPDEQLVNMARKGVEWLTGLFKSDRRTSNSRITESCATTVIHNGQKLAATMTDLSPAGAQFQLASANKKAALEVGNEIDLEIKTPYGVSKCKGKIMWVDTSFYYSWGVKFIRLSADKNDPLRSLMDSM